MTQEKKAVFNQALARLAALAITTKDEQISESIKILIDDSGNQKQEIERLTRELAASQDRNRKSICVYCGEVQELDKPEDLRDIMAHHIAGCGRHPMNRIVGLMTGIEVLIERTEKCPHCFDLGAALAKQVTALHKGQS